MKKRIIATCVAAVLCLGAASAAQNYKQSITVEYGIDLLVNGQQMTLRDPNGQQVNPFVYDGTTYVPLRAVSEILGAKIGYDATKNIASVDERQSDADARLEAAYYLSQIMDISHMMYRNGELYYDYMFNSVPVSNAAGFRQTSNDLVSGLYAQMLGPIWHNAYRPQFSPTCDKFLTLMQLQNDAYNAVSAYQSSPSNDKLYAANSAIENFQNTANQIISELRELLETICA